MQVERIIESQPDNSRKSTGIYRKKQVHRDLMNDFDWAGKDKQVACKTLRVWTKNEENFEKFQEDFEFF